MLYARVIVEVGRSCACNVHCDGKAEALDSPFQRDGAIVLLVTPIRHPHIEILREIYALEGNQSPDWLMSIYRERHNVVKGISDVSTWECGPSWMM